MKRVLTPLLILVALSASFVFFMRSHPEEKSAAPASDHETAVAVMQARPVPAPSKVEVTGALLPVTQAEVISRFAGTVTELRVKTGDFVAAGSVIGVVRATEIGERIARFEALVSAAKQELQVKESALTRAEEKLARDRDIFQRDLIARRDVEQTESMVATARAEAQLAAAHYAQQKAMLAQSRALEELTRLQAPINGEVTDVRVVEGAAVREGGVIVTLAGLDDLKLISPVDSWATASLQVGAKARLASSNRPNIFGEGRIVRIEPVRGNAAETAEIEIHLDNRDRHFHPKMPVRASVDVTPPH